MGALNSALSCLSDAIGRWRLCGVEVAPRAGFEPATNRLTAERSTTELPGNGRKCGRRAILRNSAPRCQGNRAKSSAYQRLALRRLTPTTIRSTRQVLVSSRRAARAGVMPWRAIIVQTCSAYSENGRFRRICGVGWLCMGSLLHPYAYSSGRHLTLAYI